MVEPNLIQFILNISGAAALLIWSVRLVRTGVERGFANSLRYWLRHSAKNRLVAAASGLGAAVFLQSSTAVAVLVSNFVAKGGLSTAVGLTILLGADVGSAIVTQLLMVRQTFLIPLLLLIGVVLFLRAEGSKRQIGRVLIGLALIFVSLDMVRSATGPLVANPATETFMAYLSSDLVTSFLIGAAFAWIVHSSVAAILLFVMLAEQGVLPISAAAAMILGANMGGAFIAYVLTLSAPIASRRMVAANLVLRGGGAVILTIGISYLPEIMNFLGATAARQAINLHLAYNLALAILAIPFVRLLTSVVSRMMPEKPMDKDLLLSPASALDPVALDRPQRALDCASRELLSMGEKIERMLIAAEPLYDKWNNSVAKSIREQDAEIKQMHLNLKLYLARLGKKGLDEDLGRKSMDLASISTSLDSASDIIARTMLELATRLDAQKLHFSAQGREEIGDFSDRIHNNVQLALNVMLNQNPAEARELVAAKEKIRKVEQRLQRSHIARLREGLAESIETSNIHQETLRALKQVNAAFSMVGYPILLKSGDLLKSRLT